MNDSEKYKKSKNYRKEKAQRVFVFNELIYNLKRKKPKRNNNFNTNILELIYTMTLSITWFYSVDLSLLCSLQFITII